jgi:hypothetical protein
MADKQKKQNKQYRTSVDRKGPIQELRKIVVTLNRISKIIESIREYVFVCLFSFLCFIVCLFACLLFSFSLGCYFYSFLFAFSFFLGLKIFIIIDCFDLVYFWLYFQSSCCLVFFLLQNGCCLVENILF